MNNAPNAGVPVSDEKKLLASLGLCVRAGKVIFGVPMICEAMRRGETVSVWEAGDTSGNTHKRIADKCSFYQIKHIQLKTDGGRLASALGKSGVLAAIALTDESMSRMAEKNISGD